MNIKPDKKTNIKEPHNYIDLSGKKFGKLTVINRIGTYKGHVMWLTQCDCGNEVSVSTHNLKSGHYISCGCAKKERMVQLSKENIAHGKSGSRLYKVWVSIKTRCYNPNVEGYKHYGGIGVVMCEEWKNDFSIFEKWALENGYDENAKYGDCTIDRIDPYGNYTPDNCRWVNAKTQRNNQRDRSVEIKPILAVIKNKIQELNISYVTFGKMIGVSNHAISKWFNDKSIPSAKHLMKMREVLDL